MMRSLLRSRRSRFAPVVISVAGLLGCSAEPAIQHSSIPKPGAREATEIRTVPAGVALIDLVPAFPELPLKQSATITVDGKSAAWTANGATQIEGLSGAGLHAIKVVGPYLVDAPSFAMPSPTEGARLNLRAIPIDPARWPRVESPEEIRANGQPEKVFEVDATRKEALGLRWIQGATVISLAEAPRASPYAQLFEDERKRRSIHVHPTDRRLDQAILRVAPAASFAEVYSLVEALLAAKRERGHETVSAFEISVQPPLPPRVPAPRVIDNGQPAWQGPPPKLELGGLIISGRLEPDVVRGIVNGLEAEVRGCFVVGLRRDPNLQGSVSVRFVVGADGAISNVASVSSDLPDQVVVDCIVRAFDELSFPRPAGGIVTVVAPYSLSSGR